LPAFFPFISCRAWQHYGGNPRQSKEKVRKRAQEVRDMSVPPKSDLPVLTPQELLAAGLPGD